MHEDSPSLVAVRRIASEQVHALDGCALSGGKPHMIKTCVEMLW